MTVRVLFFPFTHMSLLHILKVEDYGHSGYKGRESIQGLSLALKIRRLYALLRLSRQPESAGLGCALQPAIGIRYRKTNALFMRIRKILQLDKGLLFSRCCTSPLKFFVGCLAWHVYGHGCGSMSSYKNA